MVTTSRRVREFVRGTRRQLNRQRWWRAVAWSGAVGGTVILGIALAYVFAGYRVPLLWYPIVLAMTALVAVVVWGLGRASNEEAGRFADDFFDLKDSVRSAEGFRRQGRHGLLYELQARATDECLVAHSPQRIRWAPPLRVCLYAGMVLSVAVLVGFKGDSPAVQRENEERTVTLAKTTEINEFLREEVEREEETATEDDEPPLLEKDQLRRWVDELKETSLKESALKQYARLEKKIDRASRQLDTRKQERLLKKAAEELMKSPETRKLGRTFEKRDYRKSAKDLEKYKAAETTKPLSEQKKQLARLRAASQRMAYAAQSVRQRDSGRGERRGAKAPRAGAPKSASKAVGASARSSAPANNSGAQSRSQGNNSGSPQGQSPHGQSDSSRSEFEDLANTLQSLDRDAQELNDLLDEAQRSEKKNGQCDAQTLAKCQNKRNGLNRGLSNLTRQLRRLAAKQQATNRLGQLRKKLGSCSSYLCNSQSSSLAQSLQKGGLKAGAGGGMTERARRDELSLSGETSQLKGTKGAGPSISTVEAAEDGSGVSTRKNAASERSFRRQVESFVEREDVPEDVKDGVKAYFETIHQSE